MLREIYEFVIENKEIIKVVYGLIIGIICVAIVVKTDRLFKLSYHEGIRYFRNAFFFYGIAFIIRYIFGSMLFPFVALDSYSVIKVFFEYFLIMAGFFLFYSLLWKKIEAKEHAYSSLFNAKILVFYIMSLVFVILDYVWETYAFMFISQIFLFFFLSVLSFINYKKDKLKHTFPRFYFIAVFIGLIAWILNLAAALWLQWNVIILIGIYILDVFVFLIFLAGVINIVKIRK